MIVAVQLLFSGPITSTSNAGDLNNTGSTILPITAQPHQLTGAPVSEPQRERAPPDSKIALGVLLGPESETADVGYTPGQVMPNGQVAGNGPGAALSGNVPDSGSIADQIAGGHAYDKHVLNEGQYRDITTPEFADHIQAVY